MFAAVFKRREICNFAQGNGVFPLLYWIYNFLDGGKWRRKLANETELNINKTLKPDLVFEHFSLNCIDGFSSAMVAMRTTAPMVPRYSHMLFCLIETLISRKIHISQSGFCMVGTDPFTRVSVEAKPALNWPSLLKQSDMKWLAHTYKLTQTAVNTLSLKYEMQPLSLLLFCSWDRI